MTPERDWMPMITELTERMFDGSISAAEQDELNQLLSQGGEQRRCYLAYANLLSALERKYNAMPAGCPVLDDVVPEQESSPALLPQSFFSNTWHGTIGFFSQEIPFALLIATAIMGLGLLAGSLIYVSHYQQMADSALPSSRPSRMVTKPKPEYVGRVTGMADLKWSDPAHVGIPELVALGDKYALASGLLEITYSTGAKLILQGPVTYEVDSYAGGYLSHGRLTARLEKKGSEVRSQGSEKVASGQSLVASETNSKSKIAKSKIPNPQSPIPNPSSSPAPLFAVRTPTATVTDLGTEFGVDVDDKKVCLVETFAGLVEVAPTAAQVAHDRQPLAAGEAISVDSAGVVTKKRSLTVDFVRTIPQPESSSYRKAVLEDRPLAYWPLNESPTVSWITDRSGHGCDGHFVRNVRLVRGGPFGDNRRRSAEFSGNGYIQIHQLPKSDPAKGFTVEIWTKTDAKYGQGTYRSPLSYRDDRGAPNRTGFMLYATAENVWRFQTGTGVFWAGVDGLAVVPGQWVYLAGTFKPTSPETDGVFQGLLNFYVNGEVVATENSPWKPNDTMPLRIGAGMSELSEAGYYFIGNIAEVAVYDRPLGPDRIRTHWEKGRASDADANRAEKKEALPKTANP